MAPPHHSAEPGYRVLVTSSLPAEPTLTANCQAMPYEPAETAVAAPLLGVDQHIVHTVAEGVGDGATPRMGGGGRNVLGGHWGINSIPRKTRMALAKPSSWNP